MTAGPVIVNQINPEVSAYLAAHSLRPRVVEDFTPDRPWELPPHAEVLVTRAHGAWRRAPESAALPARLSFVQTMSAGIDVYPPWLAEGRAMSCGRGIAAVPIAEYVMAAILRQEKRLDQLRVRSAGDWQDHALGGLSRQTLGLIGFGTIGREIASRARAFGMRILAMRRGSWDEADEGVIPCTSAAELAAEADHLVLAAPLTEATRNILNSDVLARARPGLHVINVARGELLDQAALLAALEEGRIGAATLDVTLPEPLPESHPLLARDDILVTPHISWSDPWYLDRFLERLGRNLQAWKAGAPPEALVDFSRGY